MRTIVIDQLAEPVVRQNGHYTAQSNEAIDPAWVDLNFRLGRFARTENVFQHIHTSRYDEPGARLARLSINLGQHFRAAVKGFSAIKEDNVSERALIAGLNVLSGPTGKYGEPRIDNVFSDFIERFISISEHGYRQRPHIADCVTIGGILQTHIRNFPNKAKQM